MKKIVASIMFIAEISTLSFQSKAVDNFDRSKGVEYKLNENSRPWHIFKEVVDIYYTSSGKFLSLSKEEQNEFLKAAEAMKTRISSHPSRNVDEKLQKIDIAVSVFRFVWESKSEFIELDPNLEIPPAPALG